MTYAPLYIQVYEMYENGIPLHEIARRVYGIIDERKLGSVRKLISYARKRLGREQTFSQSSHVETFRGMSGLVFDPRTGSYIDPETGLVVEDGLPYYEFKEEFLKTGAPVPSSLTSMGTLFYSKRLGKIQVDPPGGLGDEVLVDLNEALSELSNVLGFLDVAENSVVREEAARLVHRNRDMLNDKRVRIAVVVSSVLISVSIHRPSLLDRLLSLISELYGDVKPIIVSTIYKMKIPEKLRDKVFRGLLEFLVNRS